MKFNSIHQGLEWFFNKQWHRKPADARCKSQAIEVLAYSWTNEEAFACRVFPLVEAGCSNAAEAPEQAFCNQQFVCVFFC